MDHRSPNPDTDDATGRKPTLEPHGGMPRWVKAFVAVGLVLLALVVFVRINGGIGGHGPGRHGASQNTETSPPATAPGSAPVGQPEQGNESDGDLHGPSQWSH